MVLGSKAIETNLMVLSYQFLVSYIGSFGEDCHCRETGKLPGKVVSYIYPVKVNVSFQPSILRGYVGFQGVKPLNQIKCDSASIRDILIPDRTQARLKNGRIFHRMGPSRMGLKGYSPIRLE